MFTQIYTWMVTTARMIRDKKGQGLVEYALIIALIAVILAASLILLRGQLQTVFTNIINALK